MKNVILILGILTTVMVYGVVAGPSIDAAPDIDMDLTETQCRVCHSDANVLKNINHSDNHSEVSANDCVECHEPQKPKKLDCMKSGCHNSEGIYPVTDHHDFIEIFEIEDPDNYDLDCLICHEKGVPRPLDK